MLLFVFTTGRIFIGFALRDGFSAKDVVGMSVILHPILFVHVPMPSAYRRRPHCWLQPTAEASTFLCKRPAYATNRIPLLTRLRRVGYHRVGKAFDIKPLDRTAEKLAAVPSCALNFGIMDAAKSVAEPLNGFMIESMRLVRRCNKPDRKGRVLLHVSAFLEVEPNGKCIYRPSR
jgi:hypothetical protein